MPDDMRARLRKLETDMAVSNERFAKVIERLDHMTAVIEKHAEAMQLKAIEDAKLKTKFAIYGGIAVFFLAAIGEKIIDAIEAFFDKVIH